MTPNHLELVQTLEQQGSIHVRHPTTVWHRDGKRSFPLQIHAVCAQDMRQAHLNRIVSPEATWASLRAVSEVGVSGARGDELVAVLCARIRALVQEAHRVVLRGPLKELAGVVDVVDVHADDSPRGELRTRGELQGLTGYTIERNCVFEPHQSTIINHRLEWEGWWTCEILLTQGERAHTESFPHHTVHPPELFKVRRWEFAVDHVVCNLPAQLVL